MTDSRTELRALRARWLRVRANVRVLSAKLVAARHVLQRDARRSDDPQMLVLVEQLAAEQRAIEALGRDLDARLESVAAALRAIEAAHVVELGKRTARMRTQRA